MKKYLCLALLLLPLLGLFARAADDDDQSENPADTIPDFGNLDEFIYQPKNVATLGFRYVSGVKTGFGGNSKIFAPEALMPAIGTGFVRTYHDGAVDPDTRTETVTNADGISAQVPIPPDGKTNTWNFATTGQTNAAGTGTTSQITPDDYLQFHLYSAATADPLTHDHDAKGTSGVEVRTDHDMGRLGKHFSWSIFAGVSLNDIQSSMHLNVPATVTTTTDTYDLYGQTVPAGPGFEPTNPAQNISNSGSDILNSAGNPETENANTTILISAQPINESTVPSMDSVSVFNNYKLHGAYLALRAGPALTYNFNDHLKLSLSAGPELLYASSTYTVTSVLTPATGTQEIATFEDIEDKYLPAVYADATLEYDISDRAGLYFGAFAQDSGSYTQTVSGLAEQTATSNGSYSAKVDFSHQEGIRTGMSFKF